MKPVEPTIPGMDLPQVIFAEHQKQYKPLPAVCVSGNGRVVTRWKLTWRERIQIFLSGNLWLTMLTYGDPLQPVLLETESPRRYLQTAPERHTAAA